MFHVTGEFGLFPPCTVVPPNFLLYSMEIPCIFTAFTSCAQRGRYELLFTRMFIEKQQVRLLPHTKHRIVRISHWRKQGQGSSIKDLRARNSLYAEHRQTRSEADIFPRFTARTSDRVFLPGIYRCRGRLFTWILTKPIIWSLTSFAPPVSSRLPTKRSDLYLGSLWNADLNLHVPEKDLSEILIPS